MAYTPPAFNNADFSWLGSSAYSPPSSSNAEFSWASGPVVIEVTLTATATLLGFSVKQISLPLTTSISTTGLLMRNFSKTILASAEIVAYREYLIRKTLIAVISTSSTALVEKIIKLWESRIWARSTRNTLIARTSSEPKVGRSESRVEWGRQLTKRILGKKDPS
jgi:hypothetical protein